MPDPKSFHLPPEEFRRRGHALIDWIADYQARIESLPVLSRVRPGEIRAKLPPPRRYRANRSIKSWPTWNELILPGITHWQSPNFFAYFPGECLGPRNSRRSAVFRIGRPRNALVNQSGMHRTGNARARLARAHAGLAGEVSFHRPGWRSNSGYGFQRSLCALLAARERATQFASNRKGCDGRLVAYASTQTHSSIEKAMKIAGMGRDNLRHIAVDESFAMRPDALEQQIALDRRSGTGPVLCLRHGRDYFVECRRSHPRDCPHLPASTNCGCTLTRP